MHEKNYTIHALKSTDHLPVWYRPINFRTKNANDLQKHGKEGRLWQKVPI